MLEVCRTGPIFVSSSDRDYDAARSQVTALQIALESGHLEIITYLLEHGADVDHDWARHNLLRRIHHADLTGLRLGQFNRTILHWVSLCGHLELVKCLIQEGANVNARGMLFAVVVDFHHPRPFPDLQGQTALHLASENGHPETAKCLLEQDADPNAHSACSPPHPMGASYN
jgi:ankyrin repeat protein